MMRNNWNQIKRNKSFLLGIIILLFLVVIAIIGPYFVPYRVNELSDSFLVAPGTSNHLLGTDRLGGDILSNLVHGTKTSLTIGLVAAAISAVIGTFLGAIAGFYGGKIDRVFSEFMNVFVMTPTFFLILIIVAFFGSSMRNVMIVIGLTSWTSNARLMRAQAMSIKERTFVKSAEVIGETKWTILLRHIIPNAIYPIIANTIMNISGAILTEASLSFLGLGDPNVVSWGQIISHGKKYLSQAWWITTFPGIMIVITVLSLFLIGDGINKLMTPSADQIG